LPGMKSLQPPVLPENPMRFRRTFPGLCLLAGLLAATAPMATAADFQTGQDADVVLGAPDFTTAVLKQGLANRFAGATGVAMDPTTGKVFVSDYLNSRVLRFSSAAAATNGSNPEAVFGQTNFAGSSANQGTGMAAANTLYSPTLLSVDAMGRLWVADYGNNRILGFQVASYLANDPPADLVLGQPNFTTRTAGVTDSTMNGPLMATVGPNDTLWVADSGNNRVLRFDTVSSKKSGAFADGMLGQTDFMANGAGLGISRFTMPLGLWADPDGRLWVADYGNNRVLRFDSAASKTNGGNADAVLGQTSLFLASPGTSASTLSSPTSVYLDADGNLWIGEYTNQRVVRYPDAVNQTPGTAAADLVIGEPDFATATGGISAHDMKGIYQVSPGANGALFVADNGNSRVLRFSPIAAPAPTPIPAPALPVPTIQVAGKHRIATTKPVLTLRGTAGDAHGTLSRVEVKVGKAGFKPAGGTANWKFNAKLKVGKTVLLIRAVDASGVSSPATKVTAIRDVGN